MAEQTDEIQALIDAAVASMRGRDARAPESSAAAGDQLAVDADFCALWPTVRTGLKLLEGLVPAWARWLINTVIRLGDAYCA